MAGKLVVRKTPNCSGPVVHEMMAFFYSFTPDLSMVSLERGIE